MNKNTRSNHEVHVLFEHGFLLEIHVLKRSRLHDIILHGEGCGPD